MSCLKSGHVYSPKNVEHGNKGQTTLARCMVVEMVIYHMHVFKTSLKTC